MVLCNGTLAAGVIRMKCASFENVVKHSLLNCYHSRMLLLALGCESLIFVHAAKMTAHSCPRQNLNPLVGSQAKRYAVL